MEGRVTEAVQRVQEEAQDKLQVMLLAINLLCERCGSCIIDSEQPNVMNGEDIMSLSFICENCKGRRNFARPFSII
jgi:hypothetical protein